MGLSHCIHVLVHLDLAMPLDTMLQLFQLGPAALMCGMCRLGSACRIVPSLQRYQRVLVGVAMIHCCSFGRSGQLILIAS